jgi:predicted ABC-type transport system involved in lysophospholipase L1 biosynthesis ATPase subunit
MLITHDEKLAKRCGRVLRMNDGRFDKEKKLRKRVKASA